ncbi:MAG: glycosyltransferase family 2 protein [Elusimicrobiota bacterium]
MKLVVQIPCYNEEGTLKGTIDDIPEKIPGIDTIEIVVVDDGSTDLTCYTAQNIARVRSVVKFNSHKGLARAFMAGIRESLSLGADIIVNTDGDNQYSGKDIPKLIAPILNKEADAVIGNRQVQNIKHFSFIKRLLQKAGSQVVNMLSNNEISDVTSGFRAFSRESSLRLRIFSNYSYTLESIIQLSSMNFKIVSVNVDTNKKLRESRLMRSIPEYVFKSTLTIIRLFFVYNPLKLFMPLFVLSGIPGVLFVIRFFYFYFTISGQTGHIQSLIVGLSLCGFSIFMLLIGSIVHLITTNRKILEDVDYLTKKMSYEKK